MRRFVTYHINKTLGIVSDHPYGNNDPMVTPIAERLTSAFYDDALRMGYVEKNPNIDKQSWYSGSVIKYHIEDRLDESTEKIDFNKIGKVLRDPENSEQIYNLLIDMFPNAKEVIDYNYYGDNEEPNPNDSFAEMKGFLWDIDNNIIKGPTLELASQFRIENEYKQDLEEHYYDGVGRFSWIALIRGDDTNQGVGYNPRAVVKRNKPLNESVMIGQIKEMDGIS